MDDQDYPRIFWPRLEFAGVAALAVTVGCLFVGQAAEHFAGDPAPPAAEVAAAKPHFNAIDYATSASIKSGTVIIGPCEARRP